MAKMALRRPKRIEKGQKEVGKAEKSLKKCLKEIGRPKRLEKGQKGLKRPKRDWKSQKSLKKDKKECNKD
jgi:hypothetical protein